MSQLMFKYLKKIKKKNKGKITEQNSNLYVLPPRRLTNFRNKYFTKENGMYIDSFCFAAKKLKENFYKHLVLLAFDPEELFLCFLVNESSLWNIKYLLELYLDGTFKTRYWRNSHYSILVFATNFRTTLRTIPIAFCISFNATSDRYSFMWKNLMMFLTRKMVSLKNL